MSFTKRCLVCNKSHINEDEFIQCIENNVDNINWRWVSAKQILSENFIEKFQDKVDWQWISQNQVLSENFIERFHDKVDWSYISAEQQLSESFIEKFQDEVNWYRISVYQKLSKSFIEQLLVKLNNPKTEAKPYIENFIEEIECKVKKLIYRHKYSQQHMKHIMSILQKDKIKLNSELKNELFTLILTQI